MPSTTSSVSCKEELPRGRWWDGQAAAALQDEEMEALREQLFVPKSNREQRLAFPGRMCRGQLSRPWLRRTEQVNRERMASRLEAAQREGVFACGTGTEPHGQSLQPPGWQPTQWQCGIS